MRQEKTRPVPVADLFEDEIIPEEDGITPEPVHLRIAGLGERNPARPAVVHGSRTMSYGELSGLARRIAARLRAAGVGRDTLVPLWLDRSPELVASALGALYAGGAYVGMDTRDPADRTAAILADCSPPAIVTSRELADRLPPGDHEVIVLEDLPDGPDGGTAPAPAAPGDLCYVTFTSGSTGRPKGVLVEHGGVANLVDWYVREFGITPEDRMPQLARPSFDGWALEVWPCLAGGGTLRIVGQRLPDSPQDFADWLCAERVTVGFFTTALAVQLLDARWTPGRTTLRAMLLGGEKLHAPPAVRPPFRIFHVYGPTETTMLATCGEITADAPRDTPPPIGRPLPGLSGRVLDEWRKPVADGEPGELHIGGVGVARGYLNRPELTAERFHTDPATGERLYATGDLVRRLPDGGFAFLGRTDDQIKLRGFRIEPGEVEAALLALDGVARAAVVVHEPGGDGPNAAGGRRLVGYWTAQDPNTAPDPAALREELAAALPQYMVPHLLVRLEALPLTPHGKTDRRALAAMSPSVPPSASSSASPGAPASAPATPDAFRTRTERVLAELWRTVLSVPAVGREDSFFDLGGDSLLAMRLAAEARRRGLRFGAEDLFETDVLHELAASLDQQAQANDTAAGR